jgi:hydrogenase expression/formation protein HypC
MCVAVPGKVISIEHNRGKVDFLGAVREVSFEFIENVSVGDYVIVHAGCAIEKLEENDALQTIELFKELEEVVKK